MTAQPEEKKISEAKAQPAAPEAQKKPPSDVTHEPEYSEKYEDDEYEYRHVFFPKEMAHMIPKKGKLMTEKEWRALGIRQSPGWIHYATHQRHILFRKKLPKKPLSPPRQPDEKGLANFVKPQHPTV